jgi:hypothetical protein
MQVQPLYYLGSLSDDEIAKEDCSDRIWVPQAIFERFTNTDGPAVVRLQNSVEQTIPALIYAVHYGDRNTMYAPSWICDELAHDMDTIELFPIRPNVGTQITIVPHTSDYLDVAEDPVTVLRNGFEQYTCLVRGLDYKIWLGSHSFTITITDMLPPEESVIYIRGHELELELLPPLDRPDTPPPPQLPEPTPPPIPEPIPEQIVELPKHSAEEQRALIAAATRRRLEALRNASSNS